MKVGQVTVPISSSWPFFGGHRVKLPNQAIIIHVGVRTEPHHHIAIFYTHNQPSAHPEICLCEHEVVAVVAGDQVEDSWQYLAPIKILHAEGSSMDFFLFISPGTPLNFKTRPASREVSQPQQPQPNPNQKSLEMQVKEIFDNAMFYIERNEWNAKPRLLVEYPEDTPVAVINTAVKRIESHGYRVTLFNGQRDVQINRMFTMEIRRV